MDPSDQIRRLATMFAESIAKLTQMAIADAFQARDLATDTATPAAPKAARRTKGAKRSASELQALKDRLTRLIHDNPGSNAEQLNSILGTRTAEIAGPIRQLVASRAIKTEGERRGTRYFPGKKS